MREPEKPLKKGAMPKWMKWAMGLFMAYMMFVAYGGEKDENGETQLTIKKYDAITEFTDVNRWRMFANPNLGRELDVVDLVDGEKDSAACGAKVTLAIKAVEDEGLVVRDDIVPKEPITFTIGSGDMPWDRAVRGMKQGGVRNIQVGPRMLDEQAPYDNPRAQFELTLQSLTPNLDGGVKLSYTRERRGMKLPISCGETGSFAVTIWKADNTELTKRGEDNPITLTLGSGVYGHGLDRGLIGMQLGEIRKLIIPPAYQAKSGELVFPQNEIAIVEVMRVPYNATENEEQETEEVEAEPTEIDIEEEK